MRAFTNFCIIFLLSIILFSSNAKAWFNATGGNITYDGNYTIHTFYSNGTFNTSGSFASPISFLIVAAGGAGGSGVDTPSGGGGGGGAGGLLYNSSFLLIPNNYNIIIGGVSGANSSFVGFIAIGGGKGGDVTNNNVGTVGLNGGSGGGGGTGGQLGGNGTVPQGNNGGTSAGTYVGGGGGGANSNGTGGVSSNSGGAGGNCSYYSISGNNTGYAAGGGGGGSTGGVGGCEIGGNGRSGVGTGTAGANYTGSGGGGSSNAGSGNAGGSGGSGIVIIRYLANGTQLTYFNVSVKDEATGSLLNLSHANITTLYVGCSDGAIQSVIIISQNQQVILNCIPSYLQLYQTYGTSLSYFREKMSDLNMSDLNSSNQTFRMIDPTLSPFVAITYQFQGVGTGSVVKMTDLVDNLITEQPIDVTGSMLLNLLQGQEYTMTITSADGSDAKVIGILVADSTSTKVIRVSPFNLPSYVPLNNYVTLGANFTDNQTVRVEYDDASNATINITCQFLVNSVSVYNASAATTANATFTYISPSNFSDSDDVQVECSVYHAVYGSFGKKIQLTYNAYAPFNIISSQLGATFKLYASLFVIIILVLITATNLKFSAVVMSVSIMFFRAIGWLNIPYLIVAFIVFIGAMVLLLPIG